MTAIARIARQGKRSFVSKPRSCVVGAGAIAGVVVVWTARRVARHVGTRLHWRLAESMGTRIVGATITGGKIELGSGVKLIDCEFIDAVPVVTRPKCRHVTIEGCYFHRSGDRPVDLGLVLPKDAS